MQTNMTDSSAEQADSGGVAVRAPEKNSYKYLMLGIWLMGLGTIWLLWNMHLIRWAGIERYGFIALGIFLVVKTVVLKKYNLFWGGTLVLIGCFHLYLDSIGDFRMRELWPIYLLIAGTMFLANFIINLKRWFSLVAGLFLLMFGGAYMSRTLFMMPYELIIWTKQYWPLTFVIAGVILVAIAVIKGRKIT